MREPKRLLWSVLVVAAGFCLASCNGGGSAASQSLADFSITINPGTISLPQGSTSSPLSVTISPVSGFTGQVSVAISGLPAGVTVSPASPLQITAGSNLSVTFSAANSATLGPANLTFKGTSGSLSHSSNASMTINPALDFGIAVQPSSISLVQGTTSKAISVVVTPLHSFSGKVTVSINDLPAGVTSSPASPFDVAAGSTQSVTISATLSVVPGTANVTFQGTSGSLTHTAAAAVQIQAAAVPDFSLKVDPGMVAVKQGKTSPAVAISVTPINGFGNDVAISVSGLPAGVTVSPTSAFTVHAGSSTQVTFSAAINTKPASNIGLTFTGVSGAITHSQAAILNVLADATVSMTYFNLANGAFDETVQIQNPGIQSTKSVLGDLCANLYVFDQNQELLECCSCPVTANGLIRLSVERNLTSNAANGITNLDRGSIAVIPGSIPKSGICDATSVSPVPDLNVWGQHAGLITATAFRKLETRATKLELSGNEMTSLVSTCTFIVNDLSGAGICTCPSTD